MYWGLILFLAWTGLEVFFVIGTILWTVEQGMWKNIEAAKYRMLEDREPADWPGRKPLPPRQSRKTAAEAGGPAKSQ